MLLSFLWIELSFVNLHPYIYAFFYPQDLLGLKLSNNIFLFHSYENQHGLAKNILDATLFFYGFQNKNSDADWLRIRYFVTFYYFSICNKLLDIFPKIKKTKQEWSRFILLKIHQLSVSERRGTFTLKQLYCLQGNRMLIRYDINSIRFYASMYFSNSIGNFQQINIILKMFLLSY